MKILYIDADSDLNVMVSTWLKSLGYEVHQATTVEQARAAWLNQQPDFIILDPVMNNEDMLAICRELRIKHDALILVTAHGKDVQYEIHCLESEADDYLPKPFVPSQLLARIRAMSRRSYALREYQPSSLITVGPLCIDALHNKVTAHGKTIRLTATESKILHFLAIHMDDVCTAGQIVTYVWGYEGDGNTALIKAHILHLRQKIEPDPSHPRSLLTVPGVGYTLIGHSDEETNTIATAREKRKQRSQSVRVVSNGTYGGS